MAPTGIGSPTLSPSRDSLALWDSASSELRIVIAIEWWNAADRDVRFARAAATNWSRTPEGLNAMAGPWRVLVRESATDGGLTMQCALRFAASGAPPALRGAEFHVGGFAARRGTGATRALRIAYCGAHSRAYTSRSLVRGLATDECERGWWVGALSGAHGPSVVLGAESVKRFVTGFSMREDSIAAYQHLEHWTLGEGDELSLEPFWCATNAEAPLDLLERFADRLGRAHHARPGESPCGWGSWGHWLERIDLGLMRETVLALDGIPSLRNAVRVVQIDDGWSELLDSGRVSASWRPNRRFPSGIAPLAAEIRRNGRECGLWMLPFTVNSGSAVVEQHPDWLVRAHDGAPFRVGGAENFCLDPTHPGAAAWLRDVFGRMRDWGVRYVKLDHLRTLLAPDPEAEADGFDVRRCYHGARTRVEAYRAGLRLIRDAMGDDVVLVGCSAPAAAGTGLVSAHRIGPDIEPRWIGHASGVRDAARALITNWFWQGRTWVNDPDYLLPCGTETETRFWATVVALSGGSAVLSADLAELRSWQEQILSFVIPPVGRSARPLDLFEHGPEPRILHRPFERDGDAWHMVGLLNWDDTPRQQQLDLRALGIEGRAHVWDAWRGTYRTVEDIVNVLLESHDAALLRITPVAPHPQVVGTDVHWAQGWVELEAARWNAGTRTLELTVAATAPRNGSAWIARPETWGAPDGEEENDGGLTRVALLRGVRIPPAHARSPLLDSSLIQQRRWRVRVRHPTDRIPGVQP